MREGALSIVSLASGPPQNFNLQTLVFDVDTEFDKPRRFRDGKNDTVAPFKAMLITPIVVPEIANNPGVIERLLLVRIIVIPDDH